MSFDEAEPGGRHTEATARMRPNEGPGGMAVACTTSSASDSDGRDEGVRRSGRLAEAQRPMGTPVCAPLCAVETAAR